MAVRITVRDVCEGVRDELASRAALQGKSMQAYLRSALERMASRPAVESWLERVRKRKRATDTKLSIADIIRHRDADGR